MKSRAWLLVAALAVSAAAAPIRVGIFLGNGPDNFYEWHTANNSGSNAIASILASPAGSNLGPDLVTSEKGFSVNFYGCLPTTGTASHCVPTTGQQSSFLAALDSLDVLVLMNAGGFSTIFSDTAASAKIADFFGAKGVVSIHNSSSSRGDAWSAWDVQMHGARFQNHPSSDRVATLRLDSSSSDESAWKFLNRSLSDTAFLEEWLSFTTNGEVIRATPGLKVLVNIDESSYNGGLGGARAMGDHPMSWYREFSQGGRFFYTAVGHRRNTYEQVRFLRRQLYNAILWAAGVDSNGVVSVRGGASEKASRFSEAARVGWSGGSLRVTMLDEGAYSVEIRGLGGSLIASRRGAGRMDHRFDRLPSYTMLVVSIKTDAGRATRLVAAP